MSKIDIVVFGATGYAGKYVVEHLANPKSNIAGLTWAVAGRNAGKLLEMLQTVGGWVGRDLSAIERIVADVDNEQSLDAMCKRARVLINCVGPYNLYGEPAVRAAIANQCDHLDLSGEEYFLKSMALNYQEKAKEAKTFVIGACGFDSAVCDIGIEFLTRNSPYLLNGVTCYLLPHMPSIQHNFGTWYSLVHAIHDWRRIGSIDQALMQKPLPDQKYKLAATPLYFKNGDHFNRWAMLLPAGDRDIARRTQYYKFTAEGKRPIQVENYLCPERKIQILGAGVAMGNAAVMSLFSWGRNLLIKHPEFFTFGAFRSEGPKREDLLNRSFEMIFEGEAFDAPSDYSTQNEPNGPPNKKVLARVAGPDAGYITCATCLVQAAVCLLKERDKLPGGANGGGVFTPAAALANSSYIERLQKHGMTFEML